MANIISFEKLRSCDLIVDAVYQSGPKNDLGSEPIHLLLPGIGNMGGIRSAGRAGSRRYIVLYTTGDEKDWPDVIDTSRGMFTFFGDNRKAGKDLHDTPPAQGNRLLKELFEKLHGDDALRGSIPPIFVFKKYPLPGAARSVQFKGLLVPGHPALSEKDDLVAIWKSNEGERFQNYKAVFSILNVAKIERKWIESLNSPDEESSQPDAWRIFLKTRKYNLLTAEPTLKIRTIKEQLPDTELKWKLLAIVWEFFGNNPRAFEFFAARIYQMLDRRVIVDEVTRGAVDGGRDAIGRYLIGRFEDPIYAEFALEAKCYKPALNDGEVSNSVGVKEVSRLISRIKHRQFGVLVTTSCIGSQAYTEVRDDNHPIVFLTGRDITEILIENGLSDERTLLDWLRSQF
jgi:hypothetical protein